MFQLHLYASFVLSSNAGNNLKQLFSSKPSFIIGRCGHNCALKTVLFTFEKTYWLDAPWFFTALTQSSAQFSSVQDDTGMY